MSCAKNNVIVFNFLKCVNQLTHYHLLKKFLLNFSLQIYFSYFGITSADTNWLKRQQTIHFLICFNQCIFHIKIQFINFHPISLSISATHNFSVKYIIIKYKQNNSQGYSITPNRLTPKLKVFDFIKTVKTFQLNISKSR